MATKCTALALREASSRCACNRPLHASLGRYREARDISEKWPGLPIIIVSGQLEAFQDALPGLIKRKIIRGAYPAFPSRTWCEEIHHIVSSRNPVVLHLSDFHFHLFISARFTHLENPYACGIS